MTDPTHDLDELASAHLDGETTPDEAARALADPAVVARIAQLRAVRDAVALPDRPVDQARRDLAIAAALDVFEAEAVADDVALLAVARARRQRRSWQIRLVGAAAVIAVAFAALAPRLIGDRGGEDDLIATPAPKAGEESADADRSLGLELAPDAPFGADDQAGGAGSTGGAATTTAPAEASTMAVPLLTWQQASDLGASPDLPSLADRARAALDGSEVPPPATSPDDPAATDGCLAQLQDEAGHVVLLVAVADLGGRPVVAVVVAEPEGGRHLLVAAVAGCERLGSVPL